MTSQTLVPRGGYIAPSMSRDLSPCRSPVCHLRVATQDATPCPDDEAVQSCVPFGRGVALLEPRGLDQLVAVDAAGSYEVVEHLAGRGGAAELRGDAEGDGVGDGDGVWRVGHGAAAGQDGCHLAGDQQVGR